MAWRRNRDEEFVDLGAPEHAWWAGRPTDPFAPVVGEPTTEDTVRVEVVEELEPETIPEPEVPEDLTIPADASDPYAVLRLTPEATWEEIVARYRRLARWWHPDGLGAAAEWCREACEDKIRQLNAAYGELRIRRSR